MTLHDVEDTVLTINTSETHLLTLEFEDLHTASDSEKIITNPNKMKQ